MAATINASTSSGIVQTADTSGVLQLQSSSIAALTIDTSQNVGIGVTPSAWSGYKVLQVGAAASLWSGLSGNSFTSLAQNLYFNGTNRIAMTTGTASEYVLDTIGNHIWQTGASVTAGNALSMTERMRIDSTGNVGIGTASPSYALDVQSAITTGAGTTIGAYNTASSGSSISTLRIRSAGTGASYWDINTGNTASGLNGSIRFFDNIAAAERMRIDSAGALLVGTNAQQSPSGKLVVFTGSETYAAYFSNQTNTSGYSGILSQVQANGNNTSTYHFRGNTNTVNNWYLYGNGTMSYTSDERLKKNIETTRDGYIDDVCKLRVVKYNWKNDEEGTPKELGLIAQEVAQVFPNLVQDDISKISEDDDTVYKQLKASVFPMILLKAIQEQQTIINELKSRIEALEGAK